jgi:hypothetical protein
MASMGEYAAVQKGLAGPGKPKGGKAPKPPSTPRAAVAQVR